MGSDHRVLLAYFMLKMLSAACAGAAAIHLGRILGGRDHSFLGSAGEQADGPRRVGLLVAFMYLYGFYKALGRDVVTVYEQGR